MCQNDLKVFAFYTCLKVNLAFTFKGTYSAEITKGKFVICSFSAELTNLLGFTTMIIYYNKVSFSVFHLLFFYKTFTSFNSHYILLNLDSS